MASPAAATRHAPTGMVCTVDHLASSAGVAMLRAGGSAADAAIAANAVLAVTSQHLCGMGGDLFALVTDGSAVTALNASGRAGSGADAARLRAEGAKTMPFSGDIRSVTVPGCVDGWCALSDRYGRLPLADVLAPAAAYAEHGFPASPTLVASLPNVAMVAGAEDYTARGTLRPGSIVRRPGIARALRAVGTSGRDAWYRGEFGEGLLVLGRGEFVEDDVARVQADWVAPIAVEAWGHRLWTMPPNSQGYLTLASSWIASGLDLPGDADDPRWAHLLVEAARQAAFDRLDVLHEHADGAALVARDRLAPRRDAIDGERRTDVGGTFGAGGTTYLCAVDGDRTAVSLIQSNAAGFGAGIVVPGVGVFLQNRGIGFSLEAAHPAEYGPGRRPPHTLCPALVTRPDGRLDTVLGTMGGDTQPQILLQVLARVLAAGEAPGSAIAAGRWGLWNPAGASGFDTWRSGGDVGVRVEGHAAPSWDDGLRARGHLVERLGSWDHGFGHAHLIRVGSGGDVLCGAADPRPRTGGVAGF